MAVRAAMPTAGQIPGITPSRWGTNILYVQTEDYAGNLSPIAKYAFYVPWHPGGPAAVFGDPTGDGVPDIHQVTGAVSDVRTHPYPLTPDQVTPVYDS
ncbi:hypothetical protein [Streptomyces sp. NPDC093225]|uniref:hypothetical protein n=1 Tax=Streptomyces sp. NPDC093225 TaxID=3366034 RepID=UPI0037F1D05A